MATRFQSQRLFLLDFRLKSRSKTIRKTSQKEMDNYVSRNCEAHC